MDPRAVQLGSLFVRGLTYLIAANSACGFPYPMGELMPWKTFDGLLFHSKYLQAHSGCPKEELLEGNVRTGKCCWPCLYLVLTSSWMILSQLVSWDTYFNFVLIAMWLFEATYNRPNRAFVLAKCLIDRGVGGLLLLSGMHHNGLVFVLQMQCISDYLCGLSSSQNVLAPLVIGSPET